MCNVSAISMGFPNQTPPYNTIGGWPAQQVLELNEIIKRLDAIDKKLGLKDCNDPEKEKFLQELAERVSEIESRLPEEIR